MMWIRPLFFFSRGRGGGHRLGNMRVLIFTALLALHT